MTKNYDGKIQVAKMDVGTEESFLKLPGNCYIVMAKNAGG